MCREFGLTGLPQPGQPRRLAVVAALEQIVEATAMHVRQRLGQGVVETPVGAGNRFGARPLDGVEAGTMTDCRRRCSIKALASTMPLSVCMASSVSNWTACR
jgi:hypothetical protein